MRLRIILPTDELVDEQVESVTAVGSHGSFGLLPGHADLVATLTQGILGYRPSERHGSVERFLAVDGGTLVKCGAEVLVSTPDAVRGDDLDQLAATIRETFREREAHERRARAALRTLEADLVGLFLELEEPRR